MFYSPASRDRPGAQGFVTASPGTVLHPSISFSGDRITGFFQPGGAGSHNVGVTTAGKERLRIDNSAHIVGMGSAFWAFDNASFYPIDNSLLNTVGPGGIWSVCNNANTYGLNILTYGANAHPAQITFVKTRSTTSTAPSVIVNNGDQIMDLAAWPSLGNGTYAQYAAELTCEVDGTPSTTSMPTRFVFYTTPAGSLSDVERLRIDSNGRITHVPSGGSAALTFTSNQIGSTTPFWQFHGTTQDTIVGVTRWGGGAAPKILFSHSRGATVNSFVPTVSGDQYGMLLFQGSDAAKFVDGGEIIFSKDAVITYTAAASFTTSTTTITLTSANVGTIVPGAAVYDLTAGALVGTVSTANGTSLVLTAASLINSSGSSDSLEIIPPSTQTGKLQFLTAGGPFASIAAAASFTTASTTITMSSALPSWVTSGTYVYDTTAGHAVGLVSSGAGTTTLTLQSASQINSSGSADSLSFLPAASSLTEAMRIDYVGRTIHGGAAWQTILFSDNGSPGSIQSHNAAISNIGWSTTGAGVLQLLNSNGGGVIGTQGALTSGGALGVIYFGGSDGTLFQTGAQIRVQADANFASNSLPSAMLFGTTAPSASFPTERMRIDSNGQVTVQATSLPTYQFLINSNSSNPWNFAIAQYSNDNQPAYIYTQKSRGGVVGTPSQVTSGDGLFGIFTYAIDGTGATVGLSSQQISTQASPFLLSATASWTTSSTTITMNRNPGNIANGMNVYDVTNGQKIGTIFSFNNTTLTLTAAALAASSGSTDQLYFTSPGLVPARYDYYGQIYGQSLNYTATAAWTTSQNTITISGGASPYSNISGALVYDLTNNVRIGKVSSISGSTITLQANASHASSGSSDTIKITSYQTANFNLFRIDESGGFTFGNPGQSNINNQGPGFFNICDPQSGSNFFTAGNYNTGSGGGNRNMYLQLWNYNNDGFGEGLYIVYARGTAASPSVVQNGDAVGWLSFQAWNGSSQATSAQIQCNIDGTFTSGTNAPGALYFLTSSAGGSDTTRMIIDSNGNVGIGGRANSTASGQLVLSVLAGSSSSALVGSVGNSGMNIYMTSTANGIIDSAATSTNTSQMTLRTYNGSSGFVTCISLSNAGGVQFNNISTTANAATAYLDASNNLFRSTSSLRYKFNSTKIPQSRLAAISMLDGIEFNSLASADDHDIRFVGYAAEDVVKIDPALVYFDDAGRPEGVQYERVNLLQIAALKLEVGSLKQEIAELKARLH